MDISSMDRAAPCGHTLTVEERAGLEAAMLKRKLEEGFDRLYFWGKVFGSTSDYLVVFGIVPSDDFPTKKFFFCSNKSFTLQAFPARLLNETELELARKLSLSHRITGDPTLALEEERADPNVEEGREEEGEDLTYREIHHLAYMVWLIDSNTSVVPSGSYFFDAAGVLRSNPSFSGLSSVDGATLSSYLHLRKPQGRANVWATRQGKVDASAVLDPVGGQRAPPLGECPVGAWSLLRDASGAGVTLRSNEYPGYNFFHELGTASFGGVYFGNLQPNTDLGFMI